MVGMGIRLRVLQKTGTPQEVDSAHHMVQPQQGYVTVPIEKIKVCPQLVPHRNHTVHLGIQTATTPKRTLKQENINFFELVTLFYLIKISTF